MISAVPILHSLFVEQNNPLLCRDWYLYDDMKPFPQKQQPFAEYIISSSVDVLPLLLPWSLCFLLHELNPKIKNTMAAMANINAIRFFQLFMELSLSFFGIRKGNLFFELPF